MKYYLAMKRNEVLIMHAIRLKNHKNILLSEEASYKRLHIGKSLTSLVAQTVKRLPTMRETQVQSLGREDLLEKEMATHSSILAWRIPWTEKHVRLQSMGLQRVRHNWATSLSLFLSCIGEENGNPLQYSCLEDPRDGEAWWAAVSGVAQSRTRLKRLSSKEI